jgi:transcription elongation factor S-II
MIVAKQRAHSDKTVARCASEVVAKWKKAVEAEKARPKASTPQASTPRVSGASPAAVPAEDKYVGDVSKRRWETDGVTIARTGTASRDRCIGLLYNGLAYMSHKPAVEVLGKAIAVERVCHDKFTLDVYNKRMKALYLNMKQNSELGKSVMDGEMTPAEFAVITHEEMKSGAQRKKDKVLEQENLKMAQVPMAEKSISDALKCGKCGQKKVSYSQAQTRSADEPMTTFCECTVCGNRWKVCLTQVAVPADVSSFRSHLAASGRLIRRCSAGV